MNDAQLKIIDDFTGSLGELDNLLIGIPQEGLAWSEKEGEWTVREVLHHLAEDCNVYAFIIERALATPDCKVFFGDFPGNQPWGERLAWHERPVDASIDLMRSHRVFLAELVGHFPDRWGNKADFCDNAGKKVAESTVEKMIVMLTKHMQEHVSMIKNILKANQQA
jgi:hypothetical protein